MSIQLRVTSFRPSYDYTTRIYQVEVRGKFGFWRIVEGARSRVSADAAIDIAKALLAPDPPITYTTLEGDYHG